MLPLLLGGLGASGIALIAVPAMLVLLAWFPGALLIRMTGLGARHDRFARLVLALAWSHGLTPALLNIAWHFTHRGLALALGAGGVLAVAGAAVWLSGRRPAAVTTQHDGDEASEPAEADRFSPAPRWIVWSVAALIVAVVLVGTVGNYWPDERAGVPVPAVIHDYIKHHAVMFSLQERPLPLGNPFFAAGAAEPVYYYHYFYLIPATLRAASNGAMSIALAFGLGSALVALTTIGLVFVWARRLSGSVAGGLLAAALCSAVGGWDAVALLVQKRFTVTLDAWADTPLRVHNILTQFIWTPQNMLGLMIAILAAYTLHVRGWWRGWFVLGPWLAHTLLGTSVWIAAAMLPGLAPLILLEAWRRRGTPPAAVRLIGGAAVVAALMLAAAVPLLQGYAETGRRHGRGLTMAWERYSAEAWLGRAFPPGPLANAADLIWILPIEFGPLLLLPLLAPRGWWRQAWADPGLRWLLMVSVAAIAIYPVVRSNFTYNDFGHRIILIPMVTGAMLASGVVLRRRSGASAAPPAPAGPAAIQEESTGIGRVRAALVCAALLAGAPVGMWQAPAGAVRRFLPPEGRLGRLCTAPTAIALEDDAVWRFLRYELPRDAVVQADPDVERLELAQLANRQLGVMPLEQDTHVFQGRSDEPQRTALAEVRAALADEPDAARAASVLRRHHITHVLVGSVERRKWAALEKFADAAAFERVYESEPASVYRVRATH